MNFFDDESKIIEWLQSVKVNKVLLLNDSVAVREIFASKGKPHYWFWDNSFVNILKKLNIDYLIWYAPFKYYEVPLGEEKSDLPEVCVIDIKNINQNGSYLNSYDISKMKSVEL